jgi:hypothetical protein
MYEGESMKMCIYVDEERSDIIKVIEQIRQIDGIRQIYFKYKGN